MSTATTTTYPTVSLRQEDGTWQEQDYVMTPWDFTADDAADADTLTEWLAEFVRDNGEGEWSASCNGVESNIVKTGPTTDDVRAIAWDVAGSENVDLIADECGDKTLVQVTAPDGTVMVIRPEPDGGYTWTTYSAAKYDHQPMGERYITTDGDATIATLTDAIRAQVTP